MTDATLRGRYRGCLLGLAAGDALGAPLEFMARDEIEQVHGRVRDMIGGGWLNVAPGEVTDDTQMMLAIARSVVEIGRVDPDDIAARFVVWYEGQPKDIGNTTARAIRYLVEGVPWHEAGKRVTVETRGRAAGNGSLMRTAPIALACRGDARALVQASVDVSGITHADPRAAWACVALDQAIVALLQGAPDVLSFAAGVAQEDVRARVLTVPHTKREDVKSGGFVLDTLHAALWCYTRHDSFEETVVEAVNLGEDADTTGAVAGALAGARYGAAAIPDRWLSTLQWRDEITNLADRLYDLSTGRKRGR